MGLLRLETYDSYIWNTLMYLSFSHMELIWFIFQLDFDFQFVAMKHQMQQFTTKIVNMMKAERLFESQGGPIILSQVGTALYSTSSLNPMNFYNFYQ